MQHVVACQAAISSELCMFVASCRAPKTHSCPCPCSCVTSPVVTCVLMCVVLHGYFHCCMWQVMYDADMHTLLPQITCPALLVVGEQDFR